MTARTIVRYACLASLALFLSPPVAEARESAESVTVERISTVVPWPRGVRWVDGELYVIGRGVHRGAGGPQADIDDKAGHLFVIDPAISEPADPEKPVGEAVRKNGKLVAEPTSPPFHVWDRRMPATRDMRTDRPYCMLLYDEPSRSFFLCGYSGIDLPHAPKFRKNATDSVHRYDMRDGNWHVVEAHDPDVVPPEEQKKSIDPRFYPHHDPEKNAPPHGWVNGPCGAAIAGRYLYVGGKDNTSLTQYDLREIRRRADAPAPPSRRIFGRKNAEDSVFVEVEGQGSTWVEGNSAIAAHGGYLYVSFRTTSQILRFPIREDGGLVEPLIGQKVAQFARYDPERGGGSANIYDLAFDSEGRLYVSTGYDGAIWRFEPDPENVFDMTAGYSAEPFVDLEKLVGAKKTVNICFDPEDNLYVTCGQKVLPDTKIRGVVYRVRSR